MILKRYIFDYMIFNPYLNFNGKAEAAFQFYQSVLGGELSFFYFKDMMPDTKLAEGEENYVMHVSLPIGDGKQTLMGSDCLSNQGNELVFGNNNYISIMTSSREETERLFKGLSKGGKVEVDLQDMFWGDYFGSFVDQFGTSWMLMFPNEQAG